MQIVQINKQRKHKGQFTQQQLLKLMGDIDGQPDWRSDANTAAAYYDGDQLPPQVIQVCSSAGKGSNDEIAHSKTLLIIDNQYLISRPRFSIVSGAGFPAMNGRQF